VFTLSLPVTKFALECSVLTFDEDRVVIEHGSNLL
jgi:hypothetical protein